MNTFLHTAFKTIQAFIMIVCIGMSPGLLFGQGLVNNGGSIVLVSNSNIYIAGGSSGDYVSQASGSITPSASSTITLEGDWTNNSPNVAFTADGGGVVLAGNAQSIGGSAATAFYNLSLAGNGIKTLAVNSTTVGGQATFTGILSVGSSTLDLNSNRLDITNSAVGAITRSSGYIISETNAAVNPSIIRWYHRTVGGSKVYPFGVSGSYIPFTFNITTAMTNAAAYVDVSTRTSPSNNQPWAGLSNVAAVSHMYSPNVPYNDGTIPAVIDRWWDITNSHPVTANATFSYRGSENTLNALYSPGFIGAQYWNGTGWMPDNAVIGNAAVVTSGVGSVTASNLSTFCPWVLSAVLSPLPVELSKLEVNCVNNSIVIDWCTASESNNSFFTVEQSVNGTDFNVIGKVFGNGTSSEKHCYQYVSSSVGDVNYFRLGQTDGNGRVTYSKVIMTDACDKKNGSAVIANNGTKQVGVILSGSERITGG
ncbi:MAG: hypothetical protein HY062_18675 [Bacteroidetes bacterium]|nr:hypothetical protein [Bacteroidota bacterium]